MMDMNIQAELFRNHQDLAMENNNFCGLNQFSFSLQHKQEKSLHYHQTMQYHHHQPQSQSLQNHGGINMEENQQMLTFSQSLASLDQNQRLEIDRLIISQNERLNWALQEQRKQQLSLILKRYETKIEFLLRQKDEEIAKAVNKTNELEGFLKRVEKENEAWQMIAKQKEEMVFSLNNTIENLRESACLSTNVVEDTESCCNVVFKNTGNRATESVQQKVVCKGCNIRSSCIIILPCSHLCLCESCEAFLHSRPLCGTEKKATIQALI